MKNIFINIDKKVRSIWWVPIFFVLLFLFLFPTILLAKKQSVNISMPIQATLIIIVTGICQLLRKEQITVITGKFNFNWLRQFLVGIMIGAALMIFPAIILTVLGLVHWQVNDISFSTIISGFTVFIYVDLVEELLFRGFIFQRFIESFGQWPAQLIIAGMFLLTHFDNPGMVGIIKLLASLNIFFASILFGLAFIKTRSLAMPIGIHFMANWVQGSLLGFGVSGNNELGLLNPQFLLAPEWLTGGTFGLEASILGLIFLLVITLSFYIWFPSKIKQQQITL